MKTKRYTTAMLIALVFATTSIQAQSARRPVSQESKERARTTTTIKRESTPTKAKSTQARTSQPARKVQTQQVRSQNDKTNHTQQVRNQNVSNNNGRQYVRNQNANNNRPVSMSTSKNPRSTYSKPNNKITTGKHYNAPVKSKNYYKGSNYYGGNHYHYAYPTRNVKFHYHHNTYLNNYHVLYYPTYGNIYWNRNMYRNYSRWYPEFHWRYNYGYRINSISVFDAKYNLGEVAMVYGRVYATWYNKETDDYLLFFGGDFPYQQFTVVVPGHVARKFNWRPERYFLGEHITITGLITTFDGSPEIVVKNRSQLALY